MTLCQCWVSRQPGLGELETERCEPPQPGEGEIQIAVKAAALNFSDLLMIDDLYQVKPPRPFVPGQEVAGVVTHAGPGARFRVGAHVAGKLDWGGFASHAVLRGQAAFPVPETCSFVEAAALPVVYTTAYVALSECTEIAAGETVLVHAAAGGVGLAAVQIAAARGATVIAAASSAEKRALALDHGAKHALDPAQPGWSRRCMDLTGGRGVDVVLDPVGGDVMLESLRALARGGRFLIVGFASGNIPEIPANRLLLKRIAAVGVYWNHDEDAEMLARVGSRMRADFAKGVIRPLVDRREGLRALPQALADLAARRTVGKVVLDLENEEPTDG